MLAGLEDSEYGRAHAGELLAAAAAAERRRAGRGQRPAGQRLTCGRAASAAVTACADLADLLLNEGAESESVRSAPVQAA